MSLCLLIGGVASAQPEPQGWRGQLLAKADEAWSSAGAAEEVEQHVIDAIRTIDGMVGSAREQYVKDLADSIVMELHAFDAELKRRDGQPANAVIAFRAAIDRAHKVPALAARELDLIDALAHTQIKVGDQDAARRTYEEAVKAAETRKDSSALREILIGQGILCSELGEVRSAIEVYERILAIDKRTGDIHNLIGSELRLGKLCERVGSQEAFAHATNAYKLAEQAGEDRNKLDASDLLFRSFQSTSDKVQGKAMLDQAMAMATKRGVPTELARFHDRFGRLAFSAGDPQEALVRFNSGLKALGYKLPTEAHEPSSAQPTMPLAEILLDMGRCYRQQGDTSNAMTCLKECERVLAEQPELRVYPWADLGELYLEIGSVTKAADYAARALSDLGTDPDKELEKKAADLMYRVHKEQGNTMGALEMLERLYAVSVSKDQERYKLELQRTQLSMTFTAKQLTDSVAQAHVTEALRADNEIARSRSLYLFLGGIVLFLGAAVVAFIDRKRRMARFDREAAQLETQALRSQMNPHFIFNALNSINAFVQKNEPDKATAFLSRFARLMRMVLENSRQSEVPLKDDLDALDAYLHLERARSGEKFDYRIEVAGDIDPEDVMVPPLVAQPFVENAIWHGMSGKTEKGLIKLSVSRKGDQLLFAIEDDGVGRSSPKRMASMGEQDPADGPTKKTSLGTAITKARLDLVRQQKGKAAGFVYVDLPQGTRVELTLPFSTAA